MPGGRSRPNAPACRHASPPLAAPLLTLMGGRAPAGTLEITPAPLRPLHSLPALAAVGTARPAALPAATPARARSYSCPCSPPPWPGCVRARKLANICPRGAARLLLPASFAWRSAASGAASGRRRLWRGPAPARSEAVAAFNGHATSQREGQEPAQGLLCAEVPCAALRTGALPALSDCDHNSMPIAKHRSSGPARHDGRAVSNLP